MDDIVKQAMAKWPDVPTVYGWLALDARGQWRLKGDVIGNPTLVAFINRNYEHDAQGRWFFQNGPQRVFVALACAPFVLRVSGEAPPALETHTGASVRTVRGAWFDETGVLLLDTERGVGSVDDRDLERLLPCFTDAAGHVLDEDAIALRLEQLQAGSTAELRFEYRGASVAVGTVATDAVAAQFGFVHDPQPAAGEHTAAC